MHSKDTINCIGLMSCPQAILKFVSVLSIILYLLFLLSLVENLWFQNVFEIIMNGKSTHIRCHTNMELCTLQHMLVIWIFGPPWKPVKCDFILTFRNQVASNSKLCQSGSEVKEMKSLDCIVWCSFVWSDHFFVMSLGRLGELPLAKLWIFTKFSGFNLIG